MSHVPTAGLLPAVGVAAGASAGGALVLGPVGLVGGYFIVGKSVNVKVGDHLVSQVSSDTMLKL